MLSATIRHVKDTFVEYRIEICKFIRCLSALSDVTSDATPSPFCHMHVCMPSFWCPLSCLSGGPLLHWTPYAYLVSCPMSHRICLMSSGKSASRTFCHLFPTGLTIQCFVKNKLEPSLYFLSVFNKPFPYSQPIT